MNKLINFLTTIPRKMAAKRAGVPFREKKWYNYRAMLSSESLADNTFIEIFDATGRYIDCPSIGREVILNAKGKRYVYRVVGFKNESRNRDWLYDTDYINPVIEFVRKCK